MSTNLSPAKLVMIFNQFTAQPILIAPSGWMVKPSVVCTSELRPVWSADGKRIIGIEQPGESEFLYHGVSCMIKDYIPPHLQINTQLGLRIEWMIVKQMLHLTMKRTERVNGHYQPWPDLAITISEWPRLAWGFSRETGLACIRPDTRSDWRIAWDSHEPTMNWETDLTQAGWYLLQAEILDLQLTPAFQFPIDERGRRTFDTMLATIPTVGHEGTVYFIDFDLTGGRPEPAAEPTAPIVPTDDPEVQALVASLGLAAVMPTDRSASAEATMPITDNYRVNPAYAVGTANEAAALPDNSVQKPAAEPTAPDAVTVMDLNAGDFLPPKPVPVNQPFEGSNTYAHVKVFHDNDQLHVDITADQGWPQEAVYFHIFVVGPRGGRKLDELLFCDPDPQRVAQNFSFVLPDVPQTCKWVAEFEAEESYD